ncbi:calcium-binding protein [Vibrio sp. 10N]|uniref:calcium-binding protein n=1 Tax=Vibrio sp. 10N TaxID=3058938 RepID=UPI002812A39A|nr:hypothetical protein VB10N_13290 [Vibrio sp. 10N]
MELNKISDDKGTESASTLNGDNNDNNNNDHIRGFKGADTIYGKEGNDVIEGNQGNDFLYGGEGNDVLFGGVGDDELTGGEGEDTFAMRITHGGVNTIKDFELGVDNLQFLVDRKHFVLSNDLARSDKHEGRVDDKLDGKLERLNKKFFEDKLDLKKANGESEDTFGFENANTFVEEALDNKLTINLQHDGTLVLTFFEGNKGTTIKLEGFKDNELIKSIIDVDETLEPTDPQNALKIDNIVGLLTGDIPVFEGSAADYSFQTYGHIRVVDSVDGRDGESKVYIENGQKVQFGDDIYTWQRGHNAADVMTAKSDDDTLMVGMHGHDELNGKGGDDVLIGDNGTHFHYKGGNDKLSGGDGNDVLIGGAGDDTIDGGQGEDTAVYHGSVADFQFQHYSGGNTSVEDVADGRDDGRDMVKNVENFQFDEGSFVFIRGHNAGDNLVATDEDSLLVGFTGNDTLTGGDGDDALMGDNGGSMTYNSGNDVLDGGNGSDYINAGGGDDIIYADKEAPAHKPVYAESDIIEGGGGTDTLKYNDTYKNAESLNVYVTDDETFNVEMIGEGPVQVVDVVSGVEVLHGTRGDDVVDFSGLGHGMEYYDKWTDAGEDKVTGTDHNDVIEVMHGDDTVVMSGGQDYVDGGHGIDTLVITADTSIIVEANGPAFKQEYKVYEQGSSGEFTIVKNVEKIEFNGTTMDLEIGTYSEDTLV